MSVPYSRPDLTLFLGVYQLLGDHGSGVPSEGVSTSRSVPTSECSIGPMAVADALLKARRVTGRRDLANLLTLLDHSEEVNHGTSLYAPSWTPADLPTNIGDVGRDGKG